MKTISAVLVCIMIGFFTLLVSAYGEEGSPADNKKITKVTETINRDKTGKLLSITVVKESKIAVTERITETQTVNEDGELHLTSRVTITQDAGGNSLTMVERALPGYTDLVLTEITRITKVADGSVTTTQTRDKFGTLTISKRITVSRDKAGNVSTTVETLNDAGLLIPTQTISTKISSQN